MRLQDYEEEEEAKDEEIEKAFDEFHDREEHKLFKNLNNYSHDVFVAERAFEAGFRAARALAEAE